MAATAWSITALNVWPPPWNALLMSSGPYKYATELKDYSRSAIHDALVRDSSLLFYKEGASSVVSVVYNKQSGNLWMSNNGKIDASTGGDMETQILLGHLPLLFRPDAQRVLVIG